MDLSRSVFFRVTPERFEEIAEVAIDESRGISSTIRLLIDEALKNRKAHSEAESTVSE
jgi:hypothetical protein